MVQIRDLQGYGIVIDQTRVVQKSLLSVQSIDLFSIAGCEKTSAVVHRHQDSVHLSEVQLYLVLVILVTGIDCRVLEKIPVAVSARLELATFTAEKCLVVHSWVQHYGRRLAGSFRVAREHAALYEGVDAEVGWIGGVSLVRSIVVGKSGQCHTESFEVTLLLLELDETLDQILVLL